METRDPNQKQETSSSYTPASFEKRTAAWMGVAYMVMVLFTITFAIFTGGKELPGTFPLFLVPAAVIAIYRQRKGTALGGLPGTVIIVLLCAAALLLGLWLGVPALIHALQNAYT